MCSSARPKLVCVQFKGSNSALLINLILELKYSSQNQNKQTKQNKSLEHFANFSKKEYFLAHGRPKLVCVQFKGSQAQITIRNGHNKQTNKKQQQTNKKNKK